MFSDSLGQVTVAFNELEHLLCFYAWTFMGGDQAIGQIVTAEMSFRNVVNLLGSLFKHRFRDQPALVAEFDQLLGRAFEAEGKRNTLIHSVWMHGQAPGTRTRVKRTAKLKAGLRFQAEQMSTAQIEAITAELASVLGDISAFVTMKVLRDPLAGIDRDDGPRIV